MITEFMASNGGGLTDEDGRSPDWIELHNAGTESVDLLDWSLTDDREQLDKWVFPSVELDADGYLVVFASGKDRAGSSEFLHTNFKLAAKGETVALVSPAGTVVSQFGPDGADYPEQFKDVSYGVMLGGIRYFTEPTPGAANGLGQIGFVADTQFSVDRGFYDAPFEVTITTETPGATIRYTTDGTLPAETNGIETTGPITISGTTTLRAAAFREDFVPTRVGTQTYLFLAEVLQQDGSDLVSADWGHAGPDWEVDPDIVNHPDPASRLVIDDLLTLPTLSLVLDFDQVFGEGGIYISGQDVEIGTSVELIDPQGVDEFQVDASVQIVGGSSPGRWRSDKLSMRLKFNEEFGSGDLEFPVLGKDATDRFDTLVLDAHFNNVWNYGASSDQLGQRGRAQYLRDVFTADLQRATGGYAPYSRFVQLYINGIYWGMHELHERPDDNSVAAYLGGDNEDYDVIKHNKDRIVHGSNESYLALLDAANEDLGDPAKYQEVAALLDIDDFIDYMLVNFYLGNTDWAHQNWYASRNRVDPEGRWRFHSWDAEKVMHNVLDSVVRESNPGGPTRIHQGSRLVVIDGTTRSESVGLITNPEYRLRFADRVHATFFDGGLMTPETAAALYQQRLNEIDRAVVAESARWGDNRREEPYTRGTEWIRERDRLLGNYFPRRADRVLAQLRWVGLYPDIEAPELNRHGGEVSPAFDLELSAPAGTIYYTTDGIDPRLEGGAIAPSAIVSTGPFRLSGFATVKARAWVDGDWSALDAADFQVTSDLPLRISEINFNPHEANLVDGLHERPEDNDRFEFLELVNVGSEPIDLDGVRLAEVDVEGDRQGVSFRFARQTLGAGARIVVVRDKRTFRSRYGDGPRIAGGDDGEGGTSGEYGGKLSNKGEQLTLFDAVGALVQQFAYDIEGAWPGRAAGRGSSLELVDTTADYGNAANWFPSSEFGGSPGTAGRGPDGRVVVNEVLATGDTGGTDQIELINRTDGTLDISNWYLSDSGDDYFKFQVADSSILLAPDGYRWFDETELHFSLDAMAGGEIWVVEADATGRPVRFVDRAEYRGSRPGQSQGRWPDGTGSSLLFPMTEPTLGSANSGPVRGPVIVSEVHYHPTELPGYRQDFETGSAEGIVPTTGTWSVEAGRYHVLADPDKADAVALIAALDRRAKNVTISATVRVPSESTVNKNALLIFDYRGPTDFKFASMHGGSGKWRMGRRDAGGWQFLDTQSEGLLFPTDKDVPVTLRLRGSVATLRSNGLAKVSYDFGESLVDGRFALGTKGGEAFFDDLLVELSEENQDLEFVELVNTTDTTIDLTDWRLTGASDFAFEADTTLAAGETLVLVPFSPDQTEKVTQFHQQYGTSDPVRLAGPYGGMLANDGGVLELLEPVGLEGPQTGAGLVDRAPYDTVPPWAAAADGRGSSLQRSTTDAFGDLATSWKAVPPTPGRALFAESGDLNLDGTLDVNDVAGFVLALANPALYEATFDVPAALAGDLDRDGDVDYDDIASMVTQLDGAAAMAAEHRLSSDTGNGWARLTDDALEQDAHGYNE